MAGKCTGSTNEELISNLVTAKLITQASVISAMRAVDRRLFVLPEFAARPYEDSPVQNGYNVTISAPHMHAMMLDLLAPCLGQGTCALDIGSGSGYTVACLAKMGAKAYGIDHIPPLVERSIGILSGILTSDQFEIIAGDGRRGWPECGPFDVIHVGAAAKPSVVEILMKQLRPTGRLIVPVDLTPPEAKELNQKLFVYEFEPAAKIKERHVSNVRFGLLTDPPTLTK
jgi:protein-L-isoaspartate(D-aspartate) O-methyltransferase